MAPKPIPTIKQVLTSGGAHLLTDSDNKLWVIGKNKYWRLGLQSEKRLTKPKRIGIQLRANECITQFHVSQRLTVICSNQKRVFISRVVAPSVMGEKVRSIDETHGTYLYPAAPASPTPTAPEPEELWPAHTEPLFTAPRTQTQTDTLPDFTDLLDDADTEEPVVEPVTETLVEPVIEQPSEPIDTNYFGFDRTTASLEATGHDFGLGKHFHERAEMFKSIADLYGAVLSKHPGYIEVQLEIDEITCAAETVFFRSGPNHYMYNWKLTPESVMFSNTGLKYKPIQHQRILTFYQILFPFSPEVIEYRSNYVYLRCGLIHHILTSSTASKFPWTAASWTYFQFEGLTQDMLSISSKTGSVFVQRGSVVYQYIDLVGGLRPIIDRPTIFMNRSYNGDKINLFCLRLDGALMRHYPETVYCKPDPWLEHTVTMSLGIGDHRVVLVDVDDPLHIKKVGDTLLINIHGCQYNLLRSMFPIYHNTQGDTYIHLAKECSAEHLQLVREIKLGDCTHRIYKWLGLPKPIDRLTASGSSILFESKGLFYLSIIGAKIEPAVEITLRAERRAIAKVNPNLIQYRSTKGSRDITVRIETHGDPFERLCSFAEMFGREVRFSLHYTHQSQTVSHGGGIRRVFSHTAQLQFASKYLVQHGACSEFDTKVMSTGLERPYGSSSTFTAPELFNMGRALHMAIYMNRSCLSIRLPISFIMALLNREPTIPELEFFLQQESPDIFEVITSYSDEPEKLTECGYDSYRECLQLFVYYQHADPDIDQEARRISQHLAAGFTSFAEVDNILKMNAPTLDYYLSGPYCIDRELLVSKLCFYGRLQGSSHTVLNFAKALVQRLPEPMLKILLQNWTGTSTVKRAKYRVGIVRDTDIHFLTCNRALCINPRLLKKTSKISMPEVIEMLTTPVTVIKN